MPKLYNNKAALAEVTFPLADSRGQNITAVPAPVAKRVQEWLTLHGYGVVIDGEPGPVTRGALIKFAARNGGNVGGILDEGLWNLLTAPLQRALVLPAPRDRKLRDLLMILAGQHFAQSPREVGGDNRGPWVRAYCNGEDGAAYRWCAGFVSTLVAMALQALEGREFHSVPGWTLSCDELMEAAKDNGRLLRAGQTNAKGVKPGDIFLCVRNGTDAYHTGLVTSVSEDSFGTIEGNTNEGGSANGYEVARRYRGWAGKRFITMEA